MRRAPRQLSALVQELQAPKQSVEANGEHKNRDHLQSAAGRWARFPALRTSWLCMLTDEEQDGLVHEQRPGLERRRPPSGGCPWLASAASSGANASGCSPVEIAVRGATLPTNDWRACLCWPLSVPQVRSPVMAHHWSLSRGGRSRSTTPLLLRASTGA